MIRYYLCPLDFRVLDGGEGAFVPRVDQYAGTWRIAAPPHDYARGIPAKNWALAVVDADAATHLKIAADPDITALPALARAESTGKLATAARNRLIDALTARGEDVRAVTEAGTFGQLVDGIARRLEPAFDLDVLLRGLTE